MRFEAKNFDPAETLFSGQTFRWKRTETGYSGVALGRAVTLVGKDGAWVISPCTEEEFDSLWEPYFDFGYDYGALRERLSFDDALSEAMKSISGLRIMRQPFFETLCSFIISANNNIKRISGSIERLSERYGKKIDGGYDFPLPGALAGAGVKEFEECGLGYRAPYLLETASEIAKGYDGDALLRMAYPEAKKELLHFKGVGPKVADCVLLFSLGKREAFPVDTWMKKAITEHYFPEAKNPKEYMRAAELFGADAGYAQQLLFHYFRTKLKQT